MLYLSVLFYIWKEMYSDGILAAYVGTIFE